ncbi:MAG: hypothetical protein PHU85_09040 [Phycisphaerae bacterium]|nr:hypothetical protein [Phycisphaerae bacterium]
MADSEIPDQDVAATTTAPPTESPSPPALRRNELLAHAESMGLELSRRISDDELIDQVSRRVRLIESLPREVLAEVTTWAGLGVPADANKNDFVRPISKLTHTKFPGLSDEGVRTIALLLGCDIEPDDDRKSITRKIKAKEGFFQKFRRKRRAFVGKLIAGMIGDTPDHDLPEDKRPMGLRERIEQEGIVSGLTGKIRGAADDYVREKLDEIEARIDRKLDEIDRRLAEWRDREIANRLKIIRITLLASIIVALMSLGYVWLKAHFPWLP